MKNDVIILLGEVYVRISFLVNYGLSEKSINNQLSRHRSGKTTHYDHFKDPYDKRVIWIKYSTIPVNSLKKYKLPIEERLKLTLDEEKNSRTTELIRHTMYHAYEKGYVSFTRNFNGVFNEKDVIETYAKTNSLFACMQSLKSQGFQVNSMFEIYSEFDDVVFQYSSLKSFYNKLSHFEKEGFLVFVHKSYRKVKSKKKITDKHIAEIEKHYRKTALYSVRKITELVNQWSILNGYEELSISSVKRIVSDPFFQNRNRAYRNGPAWVKSNFEPYRLRLNPEFNGTLWQLDGSRLQIAFRNEKGRVVFFQIFVVMDVHSRKIIGYSLAENENHSQVIDALKMAIENTGFLPTELLRDNGGAFTHKKYKVLEEYITSYGGTYIRKHKVRNPRDKAQVERFFSTFQSCILKGEPGYIGEGATTKRFEGKPSFEVLEEIMKGVDIPSVQEVEVLVDKYISAYNEFTMSQNEHCPRLKFEIAKIDSLAINISEHDFALMFWESRMKLIKQSMILITEGSRRQNTFQYIIQDEHLRLSLNGTEVKVCFNRFDRSYIKIYDHNENWIADIKETPKIKSTRSRKRSKSIRNDIEPSVLDDLGWFNSSGSRDKLFQEKATMKVFNLNLDQDENEETDSNDK